MAQRLSEAKQGGLPAGPFRRRITTNSSGILVEGATTSLVRLPVLLFLKGNGFCHAMEGPGLH